MSSSWRQSSGYTLMELVVVCAIVATIVVVAAPNLLPAIAFSNLEGSARHLAAYGRTAMDHCVVTREHFIIKIDIKAREYWCERWVEDEDGLFEDEEDEEQAREEDSLFDRTAMHGKDLAALLEEGGDEEVIDEQRELMEERFERMARVSLLARSKNVEQEGFLGEFGNLFEGEFELDEDEGEEDYEEVMLPLLQRTRLNDGVEFDEVRVGNDKHTSGVVEIEVTPLGASNQVVLYLKNENAGYYTIVWDAITGGAHLYEGKEDV